MMDDVDDVGVDDAFDLDLGGQLLEQQLLEDVALWQAAAKKRDTSTEAAGQQAARKGGRSSSNPATLGLSSDSDSNQQADATALLHSRSAHAPADDLANSNGLPQISKLLHDNPSCASGSNRQGDKKGGHPDMVVVSATAAVGGLVALTGSLVSYAVARARGSKREHKLKEGLRRKDSALKAMKKELEYLKSTAERMIALEGELAASNTHLLAMNQEVERARAASRRIEGDMALFQDQLQNLSTTEAEIKAAMTAAEEKALQAEQRRQEAEEQWRQAEERWQAAKQHLEQAQTEVETLKGELGLRGSQLEGLTRELEFTRRQLANAEKCVEAAQMETRQQRSGYSGYEAWE